MVLKHQIAHCFSKKINEKFVTTGSSLAVDFDDQYRSDKYLSNLLKTLENKFNFITVFVVDIKVLVDSMKNSAPGWFDKLNQIVKLY